MPFSETIRKKILLIEEVINFPTSLLSHENNHWENLSMVPYSDLTGAVSSLVRKGRKVVIITGFYVPVGDPAGHRDGRSSRSPCPGKGTETIWGWRSPSSRMNIPFQH